MATRLRKHGKSPEITDARSLGRKFLDEMVKSVPIPDAQDIVLHFIEEEGGAKGFATNLHNIAKHPHTPATVKARIYDMILMLMHRLRPEPQVDLGNLTEEELRESIRDSLGEKDNGKKEEKPSPF